MSAEPLQGRVQWSMSVSAAVRWKHCCGILPRVFPNQRMGHVICCTASFGDVFKTRNEGDVYHFLMPYLKEDFWSVLLNSSAGICSNPSYSTWQTYLLGRSLWSQKILLTVLWTLEIMWSQWLRNPDFLLLSSWCYQYFWYFEKPKLNFLSLRCTRCTAI